MVQVTNNIMVASFKTENNVEVSLNNDEIMVVRFKTENNVEVSLNNIIVESFKIKESHSFMI